MTLSAPAEQLVHTGVDIAPSIPVLARHWTNTTVLVAVSLVNPQYYSTHLSHFASHQWLNYSLTDQNPVSFVICVLCLRVKIVQGMFRVQHSTGLYKKCTDWLKSCWDYSCVWQKKNSFHQNAQFSQHQQQDTILNFENLSLLFIYFLSR